jgi:hypothetical protein
MIAIRHPLISLARAKAFRTTPAKSFAYAGGSTDTRSDAPAIRHSAQRGAGKIRMIGYLQTVFIDVTP